MSRSLTLDANTCMKRIVLYGKTVSLLAMAPMVGRSATGHGRKPRSQWGRHQDRQ